MSAFAVQDDAILFDDESSAVFVAEDSGCDGCCGGVTDPTCCLTANACGRLPNQRGHLLVGINCTGTYYFLNKNNGSDFTATADVPGVGGTPVVTNLWGTPPNCFSPDHGLFPPTSIQTYESAAGTQRQAYVNGRWWSFSSGTQQTVPDDGGPYFSLVKVYVVFIREDPSNPGLYIDAGQKAIDAGFAWSDAAGDYIVTGDNGEAPDPKSSYISVEVTGACRDTMEIAWAYSYVQENSESYREYDVSGTAQLLVSGFGPCSGGGGGGAVI